MVREPLLLPVIALAAGIIAAHFNYFELHELLIPAILSAAALILAFRFAKTVEWRVGAVCAAMAVAGMATQVYHRPAKTPQMDAEDGETVVLTGCVVNPPVFSPTREQFTLELAPKAAARITANLKEGQKLSLNYGQRIEIAAKIRRPRNYQNPDSFDYAGYLAAQQIFWTGSVTSLADVRFLPGHCASPAVAFLYRIRTWALERLEGLYPNDHQTAALLQAILLGETTGVERRWTSDFRLTGTYHALVISGQHISVLAFTLLLILRLFHVRRIPSLCLATIACWLYAFISGMSSPVVRAAGGFTLFLAASYFFRRTRILNTLAAVALIYLIGAPDELFDPSFQLSFLSAAAIAVFAVPALERCTEPLRAAVKRFDQIAYDPMVPANAASWRVELRLLTTTLQLWTRISERASMWLVANATRLYVFLAEAVIISGCVTFGLALPMMMYFHRLSVTGLSANIIVVPLLSLVVPLGFASILTNWHLLGALTGFLLHIAELVAGWHVRFEPSWRITALPSLLAIAFALTLMTLAFALRRGSRFTMFGTAVALMLFGILFWQPWKADVKLGLLEVTAIDVSQGDSLLVVFPNGQTMLVDAGGFPGMGRMVRKPQIDVGEDVVSPYLWSRRIRRLDYAVLTHGHSDHMDGLAAILDNFHPKQLWIGAEPESEEWRKVQEHAAANGVQIKSLNSSMPSLNFGGARVRILAPTPGYVPGEAAGNNDSVVFEITYGRRSVVMTGDAERPVEDELVAQGALHPVTLLKVGHHGSRTSSSQEFLDQLNPQFAFISDGYMNQFHHPHPDVLARLNEHRTAILRTDQHGLLTFRTDGDKVEVLPFR